MKPVYKGVKKMNSAIDNMIKQQLRTWEVTDERLIDLFREIPRTAFVPADYQSLAYADINIPLTNGQIMLAPKLQARIVQALQLQAHDLVFEIGAGTGFMTILLAKLANRLHSADIFPEFIEQAQQRLQQFNITNVQLLNRNAWHDWSELTSQGHFDAIVSTAAFQERPEKLLKKLSINGRLFAIIGSSPAMSAVLFTRTGEEMWREDFLFETIVPYTIGIPQPEVFTF